MSGFKTRKEYIVERLDKGFTIRRETEKHYYEYCKVNQGVFVRSLTFDSGVVCEKIISYYKALRILVRNFNEIR